jgi:hypothetical protein
MLQAKIDELMKPLKTEKYTDSTIFKINEECKAKFVDKKGTETNKLYLGKDDGDGRMWVYFLVDEKERETREPYGCYPTARQEVIQGRACA